MIVVPNCTVVVAPHPGRVRRLATAGSDVDTGDAVAVIENGATSTRLAAPRPGRVGGALAAEDQSLDAGQGVVWLAR